ncbi:Hypothetical protein R9X50_00532800 [Acrodontium crateriforme]|uniref:Cell wall proline rich protein n=1 Tax=Acrodontium crateriforme TaxID=150365 RepID=A0AAQ3M6A9_9PEZI|nr:Hypothetical protein R9X50_00532800 [Acrodontium crateriforme]
MAQVATPNHRHRHTTSVSAMEFNPLTSAPVIDMLPNPDFSFPALPSNAPRGSRQNTPSSLNGRNTLAHRRAVSTLPSFSFNSSDVTGLSHRDDTTPPSPRTPEESVFTPSRRGHRRGASEFVGGDSRRGVEEALSSSPTKSDALPIPVSGPPSGRRGHAHRRSAAMSSHDVTSIMSPGEVQPRLSSSLPNTPMEIPGQSRVVDEPTAEFSAAAEERHVFSSSAESTPVRPSSSRNVQFSEDIQIIPRPRPLSTISSGTESSLSTIRGHSVNNSVTSVLSMSAQGQPTPRIARTGPTPMLEASPMSKSRPSAESSRRVEREGQWLRRSSNSISERPLSESSAQNQHISFAVSKSPCKQHEPRDGAKVRESIGHAFGIGRRSSEPLLSLKAEAPSRLSTISLDEPDFKNSSPNPRDAEQRSSKRTLKAWAISKMSRRSKEHKKPITEREEWCKARPKSAMELSNPEKAPVVETPVAETDLDAVFGCEYAHDIPRVRTPPSAQYQVYSPSAVTFRSPFPGDDYESGPVVDLDAALGPLKTPQRSRRDLHSSRMAHRRAESAPNLPPFESARLPSMADVFEEDEIDELPASGLASEETNGVGFQVVDSDDNTSTSNLNWGVNDALGIGQGDDEHDHSPMTFSNTSSRLSVTGMERRSSSVIEQTIVEESSPVDGIEIVESFEEPRASSLTKSSNSSDTPTILASQTDSLSAPEGAPSLMTPDTHHTSTFSSPDLGRYQSSFDTSRLGTSASSMTDNRTISSYATGDHNVNEPRVSVDDIPSLTSSRSTMMSTIQANNPRRDFSAPCGDAVSQSLNIDASVAAERRRKRASIQSLSQLMGHSFGPRSRGSDSSLNRPQTAIDPSSQHFPPKKEPNRLKKLLFWKSKTLSKSSLTNLES